MRTQSLHGAAVDAMPHGPSAGRRALLERAAGLSSAAALGLGSGLSLGGCGLFSKSAPKPPPPAPPTLLEGSIAASGDLNPSVSARPSPLVLRVYELRAATAFEKLDFITLYQGDPAALGADLVAREELMLQPGERRPLQKQLHADTRVLGVWAAYRNLEQAVWRATWVLRLASLNRVLVRADRLAVSIVAQP